MTFKFHVKNKIIRLIHGCNFFSIPILRISQIQQAKKIVVWRELDLCADFICWWFRLHDWRISHFLNRNFALRVSHRSNLFSGTNSSFSCSCSWIIFPTSLRFAFDRNSHRVITAKRFRTSCSQARLLNRVTRPVFDDNSEIIVGEIEFVSYQRFTNCDLRARPDELEIKWFSQFITKESNYRKLFTQQPIELVHNFFLLW